MIIPNIFENELNIISDPSYKILVFGNTNAGKTTLLNSIIDRENLLPANTLRETTHLWSV